MNLWNLSKNEHATISHVAGNLEPKYVQRLLDMGFSPGVEVACLRKTFWNGPRVYQVGGTLVALEKHLAQEIQIQGVAR